MNQQPNHDQLDALVHALESAGEEDDQSRAKACDILYKLDIEPGKEALRKRAVEVLGKALEHEDPSIQLHAAASASKFAPEADVLTEKLIDIAKDNLEEMLGGAAISSLGVLRNEASTGFLREVLEQVMEDNSHPLRSGHHNTHLFSAIANQGAHLQKSIPLLERAIEEFDDELGKSNARRALQQVCADVASLTQNWNEISVPDSEYLDLTNIHALYEADSSMKQDALEGEKLVDTRFRFMGYHGVKSECRLRLYQGNKQKDETVLILSYDHESYGTSVVNAIERLTQAVVTIYELDPTKTTVLQHITQAKDQRPSISVMSFSVNPDTGNLENPNWRRVEDPAVVLFEQFGIAEGFSL